MDGCMRSFFELPTVRTPTEKEIRISENIDRVRREQAYRVCGGDFRPEPVNKEAAMLLAKAPWYHHPPDIKRSKTVAEMGKTMVREEVPLMIGKEIVKATKITGGESGYALADIAKAFIDHLEKTLEPDITNIAVKAITWRESLDASTKDVGASLNAFDSTAKDAVERIRLRRMSVVSECSLMVNALRDLRQFFLGPDYEREQKRLSDFVDLCERLKALKDSGFLDIVSDTMIRLSVSKD